MILLASLLAADLGANALKVFTARCASCHSPLAKKVEGDFDYVLDLKKLRADPEKVVPGDPEGSNLWKLVGSGNMPPNGAKAPLNDAQKAAVHDWIQAGAPLISVSPPVPPPPPASTPKVDAHVPPPPAGPPPDAREAAPSPPAGVGSPDPLDATDVGAPESFGQHLWRWAGELHLLLLHFPIVCLVAAAIREGWGVYRKEVSVSKVVEFCVVVAALAAVPTVAAGWVHAGAGHGASQPDSLAWHRWLGTVSAGAILLTAFVVVHGDKLSTPQENATLRRWLIGVAAVLVTATAHLGGKLAFGKAFLGW